MFECIKIPASGQLTVPFSCFDFDECGNPGPVTFEVLAPRAAGDPSARAELSTTCWVWPGLPTPNGDMVDVVKPSNYVAERSAGFLDEAGLLSVDPRSEVEEPILGLRDDDRIHEFLVAAREEKLWHCRISKRDQVFVPRGAMLTFGHNNRHDTLKLRSEDRDADLIVLGREKRRPFLHRRIIEVGAEELETGEGGDDRIALRRSDNRVDVLARLQRCEDPAHIEVEEGSDAISISITPQTRCDALRVRIEAVDDTVLEGDYSFGRNPTLLAPIKGIKAKSDLLTSRIDICLNRQILPRPARVLFWTSQDNENYFQPLRDADSARIAIALPGEIRNPDLRNLVRIAIFLAEPESEALCGQLSAALYPCYRETLERVVKSRMVTSVRDLLNVSREDEQPPRNDLVGIAPWIFEAPPHAYGNISEASGLAPLGMMHKAEAPQPPPVPGNAPLKNWLARVESGTSVPRSLDGEALRNAFFALRNRLAETDLRILRRDGPSASAAQLLCNPHVEALNELRLFDHCGGGDSFPARVAALMELFARACAEHRSETFVRDIMFRTGLDRRTVGTVMTMLLRTGVEFFVYFRTVWGHLSRSEVRES